MKKHMNITGKSFIINYGENGLIDVFERGSIDNVGEFIRIGDYDAISSKIHPNSIDLVTLNMGFHHIDQKELQKFIDTIYTMIKPNGYFIVREHDAVDDMIPLLDLAHSVFNVVTGVSLEDEKNEYRAFRPLCEWIEILKYNGFNYKMLIEMQDNDSTEDYMLCFEKQEQRRENIISSKDGSVEMESDIKFIYSDDLASGASNISTFFRLPEWMLVNVMQEFGSYLNHTPWYKFPYLEYIGLYWKMVFVELLNAILACNDHILVVIFSSGFFMNILIGLVLVILFIQLYVLSIPLRLILGTSYQKFEKREEEYQAIVIKQSTDIMIENNGYNNNDNNGFDFDSINWTEIDPINITVLGHNYDYNYRKITSASASGSVASGKSVVLRVNAHIPFSRAIINISKMKESEFLFIESISNRSGKIQVELRIRLSDWKKYAHDNEMIDHGGGDNNDNNNDNDPSCVKETQVKKFVSSLIDYLADACQLLSVYQYPTEIYEYKRCAVMIQIPALLRTLKKIDSFEWNSKRPVEVFQIFDFF